MPLDPVTLSVLSSALSGIAEEMGALLIRASYSSNIKERRDCSAALFDARGPDGGPGRAHPRASRRDARGRRGGAVRAIPRPGDVFILNDPFRGGTHLPDITLVSPARARRRRRSATRSLARTTPTSAACAPARCPATRTSIYQEGIVIPPVRLVREGEVRRRRARPAARQRAHARRAPGRPARAARRERSRAGAHGRAGRAPRPRDGPRRLRRGAAPTPSAAPGRRSPRCPTARTRRARSSRATA